jgi:hypothetical protein
MGALLKEYDMSKIYIAGVYRIDKAYGGPEEGGWWYDTGELVRPCRIFHNEETAYRYSQRMNKLLNWRQRKMRPVSSMAYTGDRMVCEVYDDKLPDHYPEYTPHYE